MMVTTKNYGEPIEDNCTECSEFKRGTCTKFGYEFRKYFAERSTCDSFGENEE